VTIHRTLTKIVFGSVQNPVALETSMTNVNLSGKKLGTSPAAVVIAAFLLKCQ
jgi:hypothetical protein